MADTIIQHEAESLLGSVATSSHCRPPEIERPAPSVKSDVHAPKRPTGVAALAHVWSRLVVFSVGLLFILTSIELALSLAARRAPIAPTFDPRQPTPYVEFYSQPDYHAADLQTNEAGFRYGPLSQIKPAGETRVFFLSSSVGFRGDQNGTTIAGWMERLIKERLGNPRGAIRVVNASGTSFNSTQSLVLLVTRILAYKPDILVVFHGPESLLYPTVYESRPGYPFNFRLRERRRQEGVNPGGGENPIVAAVRVLRLTQVFHPRLGDNARQSELAKHNIVRAIRKLEEYDPYIEIVGRDVDRIARIAAAYGCKTLTAVPPWQSPALLDGAVARLAEHVKESSDRQDERTAHYVDTLPLADVLADRGLWQADGVHWNDEGNRVIAERLVDSLISLGWIAPSGAER